MGAPLDPARWPSLSDYLSKLPQGLDSYPECQSRGSLFRASLDGQDLGPALRDLPEGLRERIEDPPPLTAWVPAVYSDAVFHAVCDTHFRTDDEVRAWTYERSLRTMSNPIYRSLVRVVGAVMALRATSRVHDMFQRGTFMTTATSHAHGGTVTLTHPPHLHSRLNQFSNEGLMLAIFYLAGTRDASCKLVKSTATEAVLECRWG